MSIWSILVAILMLGLLVTIHELGHFWVARLLKIKVYEVSIFIGPKLVDWRRNNVEYTIRALPFGAYVRFNDFDEEGNIIKSDDPNLLENSKRWKRLIVALAGPFMNLVLGVLIFFVLFCFLGYASNVVGDVKPGSQLADVVATGSAPFEIGDTVIAVNGNRVYSYNDYAFEIDYEATEVEPVTLTMRSHLTGYTYEMVLTPDVHEAPMIGINHYAFIDERYNGWEVITVSPYQNNGNPILEPGDYLTKIDGKSVADEDIEEYLGTLTSGDTMTLTYVRNGVEYEEECIKTMMLYANERGLILTQYDVVDLSTFAGAFKNACYMPYTIINMSVKSIASVFKGHEEVYNMVAGPIGMTTVVSDVVDDVDETPMVKFINVVQMAGIISLGLVFTNLLPIPGLDGMQLILIIVELIMGHPLSKKSEGVLTIAGFILLVCLALFAFASDIIRIILE